MDTKTDTKEEISNSSSSENENEENSSENDSPSKVKSINSQESVQNLVLDQETKSGFEDDKIEDNATQNGSSSEKIDAAPVLEDEMDQKSPTKENDEMETNDQDNEQEENENKTEKAEEPANLTTEGEDSTPIIGPIPDKNHLEKIENTANQPTSVFDKSNDIKKRVKGSTQ